MLQMLMMKKVMLVNSIRRTLFLHVRNYERLNIMDHGTLGISLKFCKNPNRKLTKIPL